MEITSLNTRFEQLKTFNLKIFLDSYIIKKKKKLNSLDNNKLRKCCNNFAIIFSRNNVLNVNLDYLFSELKILYMTFSDMLISII